MPPRRRPAAERRRDFDDVFLPYTAAQARWEAARCLGCHDAPCRTGCHASVDVRGFIRLLQHGDPLGAAEVIHRSNVLGGCCSRVCDAARGCTARCARGELDAAVDISGLEWFAVETARQAGFRPLPVGVGSGRTVAVLGAGPAGLAAAAELRRRGHQVVLYDERSAPGGALTWGIPPHRLPRSIVDAEIQAVLETGIELRADQPFESLATLRENFDGVVVAVGLGLSARLGVDGEDLGGVMPASALLSGAVDEVGPLPVVVGGGNAAIDAATTAVRLAGPAGRVTLIYRRGLQHVPGSAIELGAAMEEGVLVRPLTVVERILGDAEGNVALVRCLSVDLGELDATGRPVPVELGDTTFDLPASSVIVAAGEAADLDLLVAAGLPELAPRADDGGRTGVPGLYLAGDVIGRRPRSVAAAVASGRRVAEALDAELERAEAPAGPHPVLGPEVDLSVELAGRTIPNPFLLSACPASGDLEMARAALRAGFGGIVLGTTTVEDVEATRNNPSVMPISDRARMVASLASTDLIGAAHLGVVEERLVALRQEFPDRLLGASILAEGREGWQKLARRLAEAGADLLECNLTSPQGATGKRPGAAVAEDPQLVRSITKWVKDAAPSTRVFVKIPLVAAEVAELVRAVADGGGDGVTATGATLGLAGVDLERREPLPSVGGAATFASISGPAVRPMALRAVAEAARAADFEVIGSGGVETFRDAVSMLMVGARAVQVCTAVMHHGLEVVSDLSGGLGRYMERHEVERVSDLVGVVLDRIVMPSELAQAGAVRARVDVVTCIGCGRCYVACRDGAHRAIDWDRAERWPLVDLERCVGCGLCAGLCPSESITYMVLGS